MPKIVGLVSGLSKRARTVESTRLSEELESLQLRLISPARLREDGECPGINPERKACGARPSTILPKWGVLWH